MKSSHVDLFPLSPESVTSNPLIVVTKSEHLYPVTTRDKKPLTSSETSIGTTSSENYDVSLSSIDSIEGFEQTTTTVGVARPSLKPYKNWKEHCNDERKITILFEKSLDQPSKKAKIGTFLNQFKEVKEETLIRQPQSSKSRVFHTSARLMIAKSDVARRSRSAGK